MPEWLQSTFAGDAELPLSVLAMRLVISLVLGCVVAGVYRATQGRRNGQSIGLVPTLVLLTILIAMITLVIGNNVARAFSLVGALAIVRFRTVVEDTRDTAFVIFAVSVGMAVGAGYLKVPLVAIPVAAVAAFAFRRSADGPNAASPEFMLTLRVGLAHPAEAPFREVLQDHTEWAHLASSSTTRQGAAFQRTYTVRLRHVDAAAALVADLNRIEGVQEVELRRM